MYDDAYVREKTERIKTVCYKLKSFNRSAKSWELSIMRREIQW